MEQTNYSKLSQRDVDRAETDLLINLSTLTQRGLAKMIGCHESKISRTDWRFIASVLCAFGMASVRLAELLRMRLMKSPIKNARCARPSVLNKSRWSSEVITGSINRSHYDKYSKNTQLRQR